MATRIARCLALGFIGAGVLLAGFNVVEWIGYSVEAWRNANGTSERVYCRCGDCSEDLVFTPWVMFPSRGHRGSSVPVLGGTRVEVLSGVIAAAGASLLLVRFPTRDRSACPGCGYDLTGVTLNRCPECGFERGKA